MKITFLGTSHGVPAADRYCSSIMIESGESIYLIDAGAPVLDQMLRLNRDYHAVRACFSTHVHYDHNAGLPALISLMLRKSWEADFFFTEQRLADAIEQVINAFSPAHPMDKKALRFHVIDPAKTVYKDENITVEFIPTRHMWWENEHPSNAVLVTEGNKKVLFTGDLSHKLSQNDFPSEAVKNGLDALVCELAHFDTEHLETYIRESENRIKKLFFTHVYPVEKYEKIKALDGKYSFEIFSPSDGDSFDI